MPKNKFIKSALRIFLCLLLSAALLAGVPICINEAYQQGQNGYRTLWGATDTFLYYGSVLGGVATLVAVLISVRYDSTIRTKDDELRKDEYRQSIRPYLVSVRSLMHSNKFCSEKHEDELYITYDIESQEVLTKFTPPEWLVFDVPGGKAQTMYLSEAQRRKVLLMEYKLVNAGCGNALNVSFRINSQLSDPPFCLLSNMRKHIKLVILCEDSSPNQINALNLEFNYSDVTALNSYSQYEHLLVVRNEQGALSFVTVHAMSEPARLL